MNNVDRDKLIRETHTNVGIIAEAVGRHERSLYGNGKPGLCKDVAAIETDMRELQTVQRDCPARAARRPSNVIALASVILALAAFLFTILRQPIAAEEPKPRHSQHRPVPQPTTRPALHP